MSKKSLLLRAAALVAVALGLVLLLPRGTQRGDAARPAAALLETVEQTRAGIREWSERRPAVADDAQWLARGIELAQARRAAMLRLLREDPEAALDAALGHAEHARLPEEMRALVERPFSEPARIDALAICDSDPETPELELRATFADGERARLADSPNLRARLSKKGVPTQGIRLDGWAAARPSVFERLSGEDREWALASLPLANAEAGEDFLSGEAIGGEAIVALSGGYVFRFSSADSIARLEAELRALDDLPGQAVGSASFLAEVAARAESPFALEAFAARQRALALESTTGAKSALFIRVAFADAATPFGAAELEALVDGAVSDAFVDYSYGKTSIDATATASVIQLPVPGASYDGDDDALWADAVDAYIDAGNADPRAQFDVIVVSFPSRPFNWAGLATVGGDRQWLNGRVGADTIAHEFGHNYGLKHADYWKHDAANPDSRNPVDPEGQGVEYGDIYDTMGEGDLETGHFHVAAKQFLGWISDAQWDDLSGAADSGVYRVRRFDHRDASGLQALRIRKSATNDHYWIGFRQLYPGANLHRGAYLSWERAGGDASRNRTWLVDATPGSSGGKVDAGIALGLTYADTDSNVFITPLSVGGSGASAYIDVAVNFGPFPGNRAPSGTIAGPSAAAARAPIAFSVSASDPDGDALAYSWDFGDGVVEASAASIEHSFPVGGAYTLTLTISDMKGGVATRTMEISVSDPAIEWTARPAERANGNAVTDDLHAAAASASAVVAVGDSGLILSSPDGLEWTERPLAGWGGNRLFKGVCWTGSEFIAVGRDYVGGQWRGQIYVSPDGVDWELEYQTPFEIGGWGIHDVDANEDGSLVVAVVAGGALLTRVDGVWQSVDLGLTEDVWPDAGGVAYGDGAFVVGGYDYGAQHRALFRSEDGLNWEDIAASSGIPGNGAIEWVDFHDGIFVGSGFASRVVYSDDGGRTWKTQQQGDTYEMNAFAFGAGVFSAHGINVTQNIAPVDMISSDGKNWRLAPAPEGFVNGRVFFKERFISVGADGLILQSGAIVQSSEPPTAFEAWAAQFGLPEGLDGASSDPDSDGLSNFLEYALGSDPSDAASAPRAPRLSFDASGRLRIEAPRYAKTDARLTIQVSLDLVEWETLAGSVEADTDTLLSAVSEESFAGAAAVFARVVASE